MFVDISALLPQPIKVNLSKDEWTLRVAMAMALAQELQWNDMSEKAKDRFLDIAKDEPSQSVMYTEKFEKIWWAKYYRQLFPPVYKTNTGGGQRKMARKSAR